MPKPSCPGNASPRLLWMLVMAIPGLMVTHAEATAFCLRLDLVQGEVCGFRSLEGSVQQCPWAGSMA